MNIQAILDAGMRCFPIDERVTRIGLHPLSPEEEPPEVVIPQRIRVLEECGFQHVVLLCGEYGIPDLAKSLKIAFYVKPLPDFTAPSAEIYEGILNYLAMMHPYPHALCCRGGLGRSGVMDIAYRVKILGQDRNEVIQTVLEGNRAVCPPFDFSEGQYEFLRNL